MTNKRPLTSSSNSALSKSQPQLPLLANTSDNVPARFLKSWPVFAERGTLIDDLSFSYYFHSQDANQWLHFFSLLAIYVALAVALTFAYAPGGVPVVAIVVFVPYAGTLIAMEVVTGLFFAAWFSLALVVAVVLLDVGDPTALYVAIATLIVMPPMQLVGHVCVERRLPAFRPFEALFTTPAFLMIRTLSLFGAFPRVMAEIKQRSQRWRSWRQRTFGNAVEPSTE